jgi:hypothetical protein
MRKIRLLTQQQLEKVIPYRILLSGNEVTLDEFEVIQRIVLKQEKSTAHTRQLVDKANQLIVESTEAVERKDAVSYPLQLMISLNDRKLFSYKDKICVTDLSNKEIRTVDDIWEAVSTQLTTSSSNQNL